MSLFDLLFGNSNHAAAPLLRCGFFELSPAKGAGSGASLTGLDAPPGDRILADHGYSDARGLCQIAAAAGAELTVRP